MARLLLVMLGLLAFAAFAISIMLPSLYAESRMTNRHGVRAALAAVGMMLTGESVASTVPPTTIGVNLSAPSYYATTRALANLASTANWGRSDHQSLSPDDVDKDGNIKRLSAGTSYYRLMTSPNVAARTATIRCSWKGKGNLKPAGRRVQNVSQSAGNFTFVMNNDQSEGHGGGNVMLILTSVDPSDPIRDLDCREANLSAAARFDPQFLDTLRGFKILRFMDWQQSNLNAPVTWATRHVPNGIDTTRGDGIAIEDMISLAKQTGADPWFSMPWNADDDYYEHFARMVHDSLPADRAVYVELGNEVWNYAFRVAAQAKREGIAEGLAPNSPNQAGLLRYAERLASVMDIWKKVYADRPGRLVRVAACQNGDWCAKTVLGFKDTAHHVDALATAPYFGGPLNRMVFTNADDLFAALDGDVDRTLNTALQAKAVATHYGKRYIAYEGGQHLIIKDAAFARQIQRDPRMYDAYKKYLEFWRTRIGDTLMLYNSSGAISRYGAWGLVEYAGQPLSEAPKMRAVREELTTLQGGKATH